MKIRHYKQQQPIKFTPKINNIECAGAAICSAFIIVMLFYLSALVD